MNKNIRGALTALFAFVAAVTLVAPAHALGTVGDNLAIDGDYGQVAVSRDGSLVAASSEYDGILIVDVATGDSRTIVTPSNDQGFPAFSPDNSKLYVASYDPYAIYVYDLSDDSLDRTIELDTDAWTLAVSPDGNTLYYAEWGGGEVVKIELDNADAVSTPLDFDGSYQSQICLSSDGSTLYVPDYNNDELDVIDTENFTISDSWATSGEQPYGCSMDNDGNVFVVNYNDSSVDKFTPAGDITSSAASLGDSLYSVATSCDTVYLPDENASTIGVLDLATLAQQEGIEIPANDSGFYGHSAARSDDGSVVAIGGYYASDGLVIITTPECVVADDSLAGTGLSESAGNIALAGLVAIVLGAIVVVRRRRA